MKRVVEALALALNLPEARRATESGGWWSKLLEKAARGVARTLSVKEFILWWDTALRLHVDDFHEARLSSEGVGERYEYIGGMVNLARKVLKELSTARV